MRDACDTNAKKVESEVSKDQKQPSDLHLNWAKLYQIVSSFTALHKAKILRFCVREKNVLALKLNLHLQVHEKR